MLLGIKTSDGVEGYFLFFWRETTGGKWGLGTGTGTLAACTRGGRWVDGKPNLLLTLIIVYHCLSHNLLYINRNGLYEQYTR